MNFQHSKRSYKNGAVPIAPQARFKSRELGGSIDAVARELGIRASAIRYYEAQGLLPPLRRNAGRRELSADAKARLKLIVDARKLGFRMAELRLLSRSTRAEWRNLTGVFAGRIKIQIANLSSQLDRLTALSDCRCQSAQDCLLETSAN